LAVRVDRQPDGSYRTAVQHGDVTRQQVSPTHAQAALIWAACIRAYAEQVTNSLRAGEVANITLTLSSDWTVRPPD
jgi:hypothetical protein